MDISVKASTLAFALFTAALSTAALSASAFETNTQSNQISLSSPEQIEHYLSGFEGDAEIRTRASIIKQLSNSSLSGSNRSSLEEWLTQQLSSQAQISQANPDHPNQLITLVSVANAAKATLYQWKTDDLARQYHATILQNQWQWQTYLSSENPYNSTALTKVLKLLTKEQVNQLQLSVFDQQVASALTNRDLLSLIQSSPNSRLSQQLLINSADEFSYQHIQQLPSLYDEQAAATLLTQSKKDAALDSQSLMLLSQNYSHLSNAQDYLIQQLRQTKNKAIAWYAAAAISQSGSEQLQQRVKNISSSKNNAAINFAQSKLAESKQVQSTNSINQFN